MASKYDRIIEHIFLEKYTDGIEEIKFERDELEQTALKLEIGRPKNLGDIIYSYKYRTSLPDKIVETAPIGKHWIIRNVGTGKYIFQLSVIDWIEPDNLLATIKVPEATPSVVKKYSASDEQALLAVIRYSRLIDIFLGVTCYSLQNHLRTTVKGIGQIETDELYVGVSKQGVHYIIPVQAKGGSDKLGITQIEQDIDMCKEKYPALICKAIACQFMKEDTVALYEFGDVVGEGVRKLNEKHYKLVDASLISDSDLKNYNL